jgi:RimJ/RimL family protein N-acetyltransferase
MTPPTNTQADHSKHWLFDTQLESKKVLLAPLQIEHADALIEAAADGQLWDLWFTQVPSKSTVSAYVDFALEEKDQGHSLPFVVIDKTSGNIIGSTRYCNAVPEHKRLEIGYTWYAKSYQRSYVNTECKYLLLRHAFEKLGSIAVEFRTHWHNHASRAGILRLGAKLDGVLRNHQLSADGSYRDTVVFSILENEWPAVKKSLAFKLKNT